MPLPTPNDGESRNDFISRCMRNEEIGKIGDDSEAGRQQRVAVCFRQWNEGKTMLGSTIDARFEFKQLSDNGSFEGYGSVFDVEDFGGDIVVKGAFDKSLKEHAKKGTMPKMLWQHNPKQPIGVYKEMREDDKGLFVKGKFTLGVQQAREAYELAKDGAIDGLSIGYEIYPGGAETVKEKFYLKNLKLWEVSPVTFAMNPEARIEGVKTRIQRKLPDIREFENILRDLGFSHKQAVLIASSGYRDLLDLRDLGEDDPSESKKAVDGAIELLNTFNSNLRGKL